MGISVCPRFHFVVKVCLGCFTLPLCCFHRNLCHFNPLVHKLIHILHRSIQTIYEFPYESLAIIIQLLEHIAVFIGLLRAEKQVPNIYLSSLLSFQFGNAFVYCSIYIGKFNGVLVLCQFSCFITHLQECLLVLSFLFKFFPQKTIQYRTLLLGFLVRAVHKAIVQRLPCIDYLRGYVCKHLLIFARNGYIFLVNEFLHYRSVKSLADFRPQLLVILVYDCKPCLLPFGFKIEYDVGKVLFLLRSESSSCPLLIKDFLVSILCLFVLHIVQGNIPILCILYDFGIALCPLPIVIGYFVKVLFGLFATFFRFVCNKTCYIYPLGKCIYGLGVFGNLFLCRFIGFILFPNVLISLCNKCD